LGLGLSLALELLGIGQSPLFLVQVEELTDGRIVDVVDLDVPEAVLGVERVVRLVQV